MSRNRDEVVEALFETIRIALNRPSGEILTETTRIFQDDSLDSIDLYTLEAAIKEEFAVDFNNHEADGFKQMTVGEIADFIVTKLAEPAT